MNRLSAFVKLGFTACNRRIRVIAVLNSVPPLMRTTYVQIISIVYIQYEVRAAVRESRVFRDITARMWCETVQFHSSVSYQRSFKTVFPYHLEPRPVGAFCEAG